MATTSFLYHTLGTEGYRHLKTEYVGGVVEHHVELVREKRVCRACGARWDKLKLCGRFTRTFLALPVGRRRQVVVLHGHEQLCAVCGRTRREPILFTAAKRRYLAAFARFVVELCQMATIKHVAAWLGVSWDLVKELFKTHLARRLRRRSLREVRFIAVDEFAIHKGQRYMTVVLDLETGAIVWAAQGRDAGALAGFLRKLKRAGAFVQAVAMDMWRPYMLAVQSELPSATIVHDPFHIVAAVNEALDRTRRDLYRTAAKDDMRVVKGLRFLLLRGREDLGEGGQYRLDQLRALNEPLFDAYLLKEDLRQLWSFPNITEAWRFLSRWIAQARATGLPHLRRLAKTLEDHAHEVLSWYRFPISTGPLEGLNNKIKVLKRQAYGFRDLEYFKLRLYFIHEAIPAFPG
jgi:transposase